MHPRNPCRRCATPGSLLTHARTLTHFLSFSSCFSLFLSLPPRHRTRADRESVPLSLSFSLSFLLRRHAAPPDIGLAAAATTRLRVLTRCRPHARTVPPGTPWTRPHPRLNAHGRQVSGAPASRAPRDMGEMSRHGQPPAGRPTATSRTHTHTPHTHAELAHDSSFQRARALVQITTRGRRQICLRNKCARSGQK